MGKANIARGEKWFNVRKRAVFEENTKDTEWLDNQPAIVKDIQEYEASIKPVEKKETKSTVKK